MTSYPLLSLTTIHLEKVINKLQAKSYFRLQQTCSAVYEFIRASRNISVHISADFYGYAAIPNGSCIFRDQKDINDDYLITGNALYGTRIGRLDPLNDMERYDVLCATLERNRITCSYLFLYELVLTDDQIEHILNIVKPRNLCVQGAIQKLDPLFRSKTLKNRVELQIQAVPVITEIKRLLSSFEHVRIVAPGSTSDVITLISDLIAIFKTAVFPNLRKFSLKLKPETGAIPVDRIKKLLCNWKIEGGKRQRITTRIPTVHDGSCCRIVMDVSDAKIVYNRDEEDADELIL